LNYCSTARCWALAAFFSFMILYTACRTPSTGDQPITRPLPKHITTQTHNIRTQTSIPWVGFEPMIPAVGWAKTVHALDRAATVRYSSFTFPPPPQTVTFSIKYMPGQFRWLVTRAEGQALYNAVAWERSFRGWVLRFIFTHRSVHERRGGLRALKGTSNNAVSSKKSNKFWVEIICLEFHR
jgi:hypothetical protein